MRSAQLVNRKQCYVSISRARNDARVYTDNALALRRAVAREPNDVLAGEMVAMEVKHCCAGCGEIMAVHEHSSWQEIKDRDRNRRALCDAGRSWPRCPLPQERTRGQEESA